MGISMEKINSGAHFSSRLWHHVSRETGKVERRNEVNEITGAMLSGVLSRMLGRSPYVSGYRKASDGRIVRFIDWSRAARRGAAI